ncbi:MAG: hypothetical protein GY940_17760, partial [bacterium]|nr:hypothetical protein [bacterium]
SVSMNFPNVVLADFFFSCDMALTNSLRSPEIMEQLVIYRYDESRIREGFKLYDKAFSLDEKRNTIYVNLLLALELVEKISKETKQIYYNHLELARMVFKNEKGLLDKLEARGRRKVAMGSRIKQAKVFYINSLASEEIFNGLNTLGVTKKMLRQGLKQVEKLELAVVEKEARKGDARKATKDRDEAIKELKRWMADFRRICFLALNGSQLLEKLGWKVKS